MIAELKLWNTTARSREDMSHNFVETQIEILDGQSSGLFSNELFEKRPVLTIEDCVLHSDGHFQSPLLGIGLYLRYKEQTLLSHVE